MEMEIEKRNTFAVNLLLLLFDTVKLRNLQYKDLKIFEK